MLVYLGEETMSPYGTVTVCTNSSTLPTVRPGCRSSSAAHEEQGCLEGVATGQLRPGASRWLLSAGECYAPQRRKVSAAMCTRWDGRRGGEPSIPQMPVADRFGYMTLG